MVAVPSLVIAPCLSTKSGELYRAGRPFAEGMVELSRFAAGWGAGQNARGEDDWKGGGRQAQRRGMGRICTRRDGRAGRLGDL